MFIDDGDVDVDMKGKGKKEGFEIERTMHFNIIRCFRQGYKGSQGVKRRLWSRRLK